MAEKEYIEREKALDFISEVEPIICIPPDNKPTFTAVKDPDMVAYLESIPAADVRPVVLCRECKYWETDWTPRGASDGRHYCAPLDLFPSADWFCADGEKREES